MKVQMRGNRVGVEQLKKAKQAAYLQMPEDANNVGIIRLVGDGVEASDLVVGSKVYFGNKREQIKIEGKDILVMAEDNVLAIAGEEELEAQEAAEA